MIKKHNSLTRSEKVINSFINSMYQNDNLDGVVEVFKRVEKQGYVMKLYKTYDTESDLCIWVYEDLNKRTVNTVIGNHNNCDVMNGWFGENLKHKQYPIVTNIKKEIVEDLVEDIYAHYGKSIKI